MKHQLLILFIVNSSSPSISFIQVYVIEKTMSDNEVIIHFSFSIHTYVTDLKSFFVIKVPSISSGNKKSKMKEQQHKCPTCELVTFKSEIENILLTFNPNNCISLFKVVMLVPFNHTHENSHRRKTVWL